MTERMNRQALEKLAKQIHEDQGKASSAEKRFKLNMSFEKAVKKISKTKPPKKP